MAAADLACSVRVTVGITVVCLTRAVVVEQLNLWGRSAIGSVDVVPYFFRFCMMDCDELRGLFM